MTMFADTHDAATPRPWLSFFDFFARDREAELRSLLTARDVTIISTRQVEGHILKMNRINRPTFWHSVIHIIGYVTSILSLRLPLHFLLRTNSAFTSIIAMTLACVGIVATVFGTSSIFALPAAAWSFELTVFLLLVIMDEGEAPRVVLNAINRWHLYRPSAFLREALPDHIQQRLSTLEEIPGVRPFVLADTTDPFLVAVYGYGPFAARCYVGAWATGDAKLDAFR